MVIASAANSPKGLIGKWFRNYRCYFNVTESGTSIKYPPPPLDITNEADLWKDANVFLYKKLARSILYAGGAYVPTLFVGM